jgi:hypothetical protein
MSTPTHHAGLKVPVRIVLGLQWLQAQSLLPRMGPVACEATAADVCWAKRDMPGAGAVMQTSLLVHSPSLGCLP